MALYKGNSKIKDLYKGSIKLSKLYHGSTLVYSSSAYIVDQVIFEQATAGTYSLDILEDGQYYIDIVGGGGGSVKGHNYNGGEGAYITGTTTISKGTYSIVVGAGGASSTSSSGYGKTGGTSSFLNNLAKGGTGNSTGINYRGQGGDFTVVSSGLTGTKGKNTSIVGWINGYGAGGRSTINGTAGYVKIVYKGT